VEFRRFENSESVPNNRRFYEACRLYRNDFDMRLKLQLNLILIENIILFVVAIVGELTKREYS